MQRGSVLLHSVAERIVGRWLTNGGAHSVRIDPNAPGEITYDLEGGVRTARVKADPYFGADATLCTNRSLAFYRPATGLLALEALESSLTRAPGWALESNSDELLYYLVALGQTEEEIAALMAQSDEVFFGGLAVERDELLRLPMGELNSWFSQNLDRYTPRPVISGNGSAWYRLVPRADVERALPGMRSLGAIFESL